MGLTLPVRRVAIDVLADSPTSRKKRLDPIS